jgi:hypothetical protein
MRQSKNNDKASAREDRAAKHPPNDDDGDLSDPREVYKSKRR